MSGYILVGSIHTMDPAHPHAEAMAVLGDRIVRVGSRQQARAALPRGAPEIRARGEAVVPGLIDTHNHMLWTAAQSRLVDLSGARSVEDICLAVGDYAAVHPDREWLVGGPGWHVEHIREKRYPTRDELDAVSPVRPVFLPRIGHAAVCNSAALARAGIDENMPDPPGGRIVRESGSRAPTGLLLEPPACDLVARLVPPLTAGVLRSALAKTQQDYLKSGLTGVIEPGLDRESMNVYQECHASGGLLVRTVLMPLADPNAAHDTLTDWLESWGVRTGFGSPSLKLGGVKLYVDGGASLGTALMREPYPDEVCNCGLQVTSNATFAHIAELCARLGWSLGVHVVAGRGIPLALPPFSEVDRRHPIRDLRFSLIHAYLWPSSKNIETAGRLGVAVATQPSMQYTFAPLLIRRFGADAVGRATPIRSWLDGGVRVGGGSDSPVTPYPPLLGIWHATTRRIDAADEPVGRAEAVSATDAVIMYTSAAAWLSFSEHERGMLKPGLLADWVELSADPFRCDPDDLRSLGVMRTGLGGEIVHEA